jgi:ribosomal protein S18 acetylase RimI-like enzyme
MSSRDHAVTLRAASAADLPVLTRMLALAADWRDAGSARSEEALLADPHLRLYVESWPRAGDAGVVALDHSGRPVGASWFRFFTAAEPGYGFVDAATPELSIAVDAGSRGRGVGEALLRELVRAARSRGVDAMSLSVEPDNPARRLYERVGFASVPVDGPAGAPRDPAASLTMRLPLSP